jgi:hypothetical protein
VAATLLEMGISFKLSKVGVRVHPAARTASAAGAEKSAATEKEGSVSDPRSEVRGASVVCSVGFFFVPSRDSEGRVGGGGDLRRSKITAFSARKR